MTRSLPRSICSADGSGPRRRFPRSTRSPDSSVGRPQSRGRSVNPRPSQASPSGSRSTTSLNSNSSNRSQQRPSTLGYAAVPPAVTDAVQFPRSPPQERSIDGGRGSDGGEGEGGGASGPDASSSSFPSKGSQSPRSPAVSRGRSPVGNSNRVSRSYARSASPVRRSPSPLRQSASPPVAPIFPSHLVGSSLYPSGSPLVPSPLSRSRSRSPSAACRSPREMLNPHTLDTSLGSRPSTDRRTSHEGAAGPGAKTEALRSSRVAQRAREANVGIGLTNLSMGSPDSRGSPSPPSETQTGSTSPPMESAALLLKQASSFWLVSVVSTSCYSSPSEGVHYLNRCRAVDASS